jgi:hypothetical protein
MMAQRWRTALALALIAAGAGTAKADKIKNPTAVFSGLDKITGRIISFEVGVGETVQFGALQMIPRVCYTRPPTESPNTTAFVEIDEVTLDSKYRRVFSGWMFAASPGLHGVEHPVYDVWLVDCKGGTEVIAEPKERPAEPAAHPAPTQPERAAQPDRPRRQAGQPPADLVAPQRSAPSGIMQPPADLFSPQRAMPPRPIRPPAEALSPPGEAADLLPPQPVPGAPAQQPARRYYPNSPGGFERGDALR